MQHVPTRWGTLNGCFKSLQVADNILNGLESRVRFFHHGKYQAEGKTCRIKAVLTDPDFVTKLDECIAILARIDMYIKIFQSDAGPCPDVYKAFLELEEKMRNLPNVDTDKKSYLVELVRNFYVWGCT